MHVSLTNPKNNEVKTLKIGWSWTVLFFGGFLGIPLFIRRLYGYGMLFIALYVIYLIFRFVLVSPLAVDIIAIVQFIITVWVAIVANELAVKTLLGEGWIFTDEDSDGARKVKEQLGLE